MGVFWGAWASVLPAVKEGLGASDPEFGAALLFVGVGALPAMLLTGRMWHGRRRALLIATPALFAAAVLLPGLAPSVSILALSLALVGAASGALDVAMNSAVSDIEAAGGPRLMFRAHALFSLFVLVGAASGGVLRQVGVAPLGVLTLTALTLLAAAALAVAGFRPPETGGGHAAIVDAAMPGGDRASWINGAVLLMGGLCAVAFMLEDALQSWSALHLERSFGASPAISALGPGVFGATMFVGRSAGQRLGRGVTDRVLLAAAGSAAAAGLLLAAVAGTALVCLVGLGMAGAGVSLTAPALFGRVGRLAGGAARARALSGVTVMGYLGFVAGPPVVGAIAGVATLRTAFAALAVLALGLAVVGFLALGDRPRAGKPDARSDAPELPVEPPLARA